MPAPNVVVILADDMGYGDLSCLNDRSKIPTPNMDRLAAEGMTFTDGHASSAVCTPSRYGLLTGRYAWRGPLQRGVLGPVEPPLIGDHEMTLPRWLGQHGYHSACIGKWHLGWNWPFKHKHDLRQPGIHWRDQPFVDAIHDIDYDRPITGGPTAVGFDTYFGVDVPNFPPYCFIENDRALGTPTVPKPDEMFGLGGPMLEDWSLEAIMPELTRRAERYIGERARTGQPFFLYFAMTGPHTPIVPLPEFRGRSEAGDYGDYVVQLDDTIGRIDAALRRAGVADDTLLLVTSDNGSPGREGSFEAPGTVEMLGHEPNWILRGRKGCAWDGGHRIPWLVKWPARVEAGSRCDELACLTDLWATLAAALDRPMPDRGGEDSLNLLPYLTQTHDGPPIRDTVVHHDFEGGYSIRQGPWKLIMHTGSGATAFCPNPPRSAYDPPGQLYHMHRDIREQANRYVDEPDVVRDLKVSLARLQRHPQRTLAEA